MSIDRIIDLLPVNRKIDRTFRQRRRERIAQRQPRLIDVEDEPVQKEESQPTVKVPTSKESESTKTDKIVEKVHELNQSEQEEPTKPNTEELANETKTKTEANSVTETEEEESDKVPSSLGPAEGSVNPKLSVEAEEETIKLSVEPEFTTPMLTSANTSKKSELSIMMDMCKFMHNQQQTYWKYAKIRDDSI
ncbi:hypothetical protein J1N35_033850 [Gossypium stocksii]|uniref:Uncharacterized protein n=1 Tax=Gossypium stocksii TaxID=47602 RepID=A0A9D3UQY1_9ROSI|nr:hypothetical protein J1N35_033850 [Gossypium stocksii]